MMLDLGKNKNIGFEQKIKLAIIVLSKPEIKEIRNMSRNDKCICGSEKKFKKCHLELFEQLTKNK